MKITEYESGLKYEVPQITCDSPIHKQIKSPLPNTAFFMAFIGSAGSGKSSAAISWLTHPEMYNKVFHNIFIVMPSSSRASLKGDPFQSHPKEKLFDELTVGTLEFVKAFCEVSSAEGHHSLLFMDDVGAELKNKDIQHLLKQLIFNRRHLRLSIQICTQSYNTIPLSIRKNISHLVAFKFRNKKECELLFSELIFVDKKVQLQLLNHIFDSQYNFMFVNTALNRIYKNFNLIEFED